LRLQQLIADAPERWPEIEPGLRRVLFKGFPFSVLYEVEGDCVTIIAVAHQRRRPGYWRNR
jgi:plasmid stabilization system protein ParE